MRPLSGLILIGPEANALLDIRVGSDVSGFHAKY